MIKVLMRINISIDYVHGSYISTHYSLLSFFISSLEF